MLDDREYDAISGTTTIQQLTQAEKPVEKIWIKLGYYVEELTKAAPRTITVIP